MERINQVKDRENNKGGTKEYKISRKSDNTKKEEKEGNVKKYQIGKKSNVIPFCNRQYEGVRVDNQIKYIGKKTDENGKEVDVYCAREASSKKYVVLEDVQKVFYEDNRQLYKTKIYKGDDDILRDKITKAQKKAEVIFSTPWNIEDIIKDKRNKNKMRLVDILTNGLELCQNAAGQMMTDRLFDIGGITSDGEIIRNNKNISSGYRKKIEELRIEYLKKIEKSNKKKQEIREI